jgi:creatinine amidohydrolase
MRKPLTNRTLQTLSRFFATCRKKKKHMKNYNYTDILDCEHVIPILPWGSHEPHGEHLPYTTDSILAEAVANGVSDKANEKYENIVYGNTKGLFAAPFHLLPTMSLGSQNVSQVENYELCIHFNTDTQKSVLEDIVESLARHGIYTLFIINGHNGNALKGIIRDVMVKYPHFKIYLCNYLDVVGKYHDELKKDGVIKYDLDEHAGYTETSLMLYVSPDLVHLENIKYENPGSPKSGGEFWTPSDWKKRSVKSRVGTVGMSSENAGEKIFEFVTDKLSDEIVEIVRKEEENGY